MQIQTEAIRPAICTVRSHNSRQISKKHVIIAVFFLRICIISKYQRRKKRQEVGENCIIRNFITCTLLQV
jgi:hypothetical protein